MSEGVFPVHIKSESGELIAFTEYSVIARSKDRKHPTMSAAVYPMHATFGLLSKKKSLWLDIEGSKLTITFRENDKDVEKRTIKLPVNMWEVVKDESE